MNKLFFLLILLSFVGCKVTKDNAKLALLKQEDQKDRIDKNPNYSANDVGRLLAVKELLKVSTLKTSNDFYNAAVVLQHADSAADFLQANEFAKKAVQLNKKNIEAKTLIAQSLDRYLLKSGKPQIYGTQRFVFRDKEYLQPIDTSVITDSERRDYGVASLKNKLIYFNKIYNKNETSILSYVIQDSTKRRLTTEVSVEIVGGVPDIVKQIIYPTEALNNKISGKVLLELTIDKNGYVKDIVVVKGLGFGCDKEAMRVIKLAKFINYTGEDAGMRINIPFLLPG